MHLHWTQPLTVQAPLGCVCTIQDVAKHLCVLLLTLRFCTYLCDLLLQVQLCNYGETCPATGSTNFAMMAWPRPLTRKRAWNIIHCQVSGRWPDSWRSSYNYWWTAHSCCIILPKNGHSSISSMTPACAVIGIELGKVEFWKPACCICPPCCSLVSVPYPKEGILSAVCISDSIPPTVATYIGNSMPQWH